MEQEFNSRQAWEFEILKRWLEIMDVAEAFRINHISENKDTDIRNLYAAKLTRLWGELLPKVIGRTEFGDVEDKFKEFRPYYYDPGMFFEKDDSARIYELEECLRMVLERLKIT
jgi:hypothetical protein